MVDHIDRMVYGSLAVWKPEATGRILQQLTLVHHSGRIRQGTPGRWTPDIEGIVLQTGSAQNNY